MNQCDVEMMLARAQIGLATLFAIGFFSLLFLLMFLHKDMSPTEVTILTGLVSVLGTLLTQQIQFFFSRSRPRALPDPTTTTTQTTTVTGPTPIVVPEGSQIVTAPVPPAAIITTPLPPTPEKPA